MNSSNAPDKPYQQRQQAPQQGPQPHSEAYTQYIGMRFPPRTAHGYLNPFLMNPHAQHMPNYPLHPAEQHSSHNPFDTNSMVMSYSSLPNVNNNNNVNSSGYFPSSKMPVRGQDQNQAEMNPPPPEVPQSLLPSNQGRSTPVPMERDTTDDFFDLSDTFFNLDGLLDECNNELLPPVDSHVLSSDIQHYLNGWTQSSDMAPSTSSPSPQVQSSWTGSTSCNHCQSRVEDTCHSKKTLAISPTASATSKEQRSDVSSSQSHHYQRLAQNKPTPLKIPPRQVSRIRDEERGELSSPLKRSRRSLEEVATSSPSSTPPRTSSMSDIELLQEDDDEQRLKKRRRININLRSKQQSPESDVGVESPKSSSRSESVSSPESVEDDPSDSQKTKSSLMCLGRVKRKRLPKVYDSMVLRFQCM